MGLCCWAKGYHEPLYMVSNMATAEEACRLYEKRFRLETFFSDQKSRGFHLHKSHVATRQIEELMQELKQHFTLILVTHNLQQARRVSDTTAFMLAGEERTGALIEYDDTQAIFEHAKDERTRDYPYSDVCI